MFVQSRSIASTAHTDVKRPEMWSKLDRGKSTEAISVVLMSLDYLSPTHFAVKKNLTYAQVLRSKAVTIFFDAILIQFSGISNRRTSKQKLFFGIMRQNWTR